MPTAPTKPTGRKLRAPLFCELCVELGGCLTGEHGVGIEKRELMATQFTATDLDVQMRIKSVFDPGWRLNPAKVFPLDASESLRAGLAARAPEAA